MRQRIVGGGAGGEWPTPLTRNSDGAFVLSDPKEPAAGIRSSEIFCRIFFSKDDILLRVRYKEIDSGCGMPPCVLLPLGGRAACLWKICNLFFYSHRAGRPLARAMSYLKERYMKIRTAALAALCGGVFLLSGVTAQAETVKTPVHRIDAAGMHDELGTIIFADSPDGLVIDVNLAGLPAGPHGMHIHEKGDCGPAPATKGGQPMAGYAAGGHYDPDNTGSHKARSPWAAIRAICRCWSCRPEARSSPS